MSNCLYCNEYVIDDENAGMTDDGSYRLYHPECQSDSIEDLNISLLIAGRNMGYRWMMIEAYEIEDTFESGRYAVMHREGKFTSDKERWDAAVKECLRIHQQITLDDQNKNDIKIYCDETWAAYVKRCLES